MSSELDRGFRVGDWEVKPLRGILSANGETRRLEPRVMAVLVCLAEHAGDPVTKLEARRLEAVLELELVGLGELQKAVRL